MCLAGVLFSPLAQATTVRLDTVLGSVDIELYDAEAPQTVANFLSYVRSGAYNGSFIHRSVQGFVIQGGGFTWNDGTQGPVKIPAGPPVVNEFSPARSNLRGTVAMAKLSGQPNSATTEWFVNLGNNAGNLDSQNGGFTVFGKISEAGMAVVDAIAAKPVVNAGGAFNTLPLLAPVPSNATLTRADLVIVKSAAILTANNTSSDADRLFNYLQHTYPQFAAPANPDSTSLAGYYLRYYSATNSYIGTADGQVYYLVPSISSQIQRLGTLADWLAIAKAAGY
jgi:cyclophilin family peptidyl-prolyl cis-trans isomerase